MIVTAKYRSTVSARRRGRPDPVTMWRWRNLDLLIEEVPRDYLSFALSCEMLHGTVYDGVGEVPGRLQSMRLLAGPTGELYHCVCPVADLSVESQSEWFCEKVLGFERQFAEDCLDQYKSAKIVEDHGPGQDTAITLLAAKAFICGDHFYAPAPEPCFQVGYEQDGSIAYLALRQGKLQGGYHTFRIDQLEEALQLVRQSGFRNDRVSRLREAFRVDIAWPDILKHDPVATAVIGAADAMVTHYRTGVHTLPLDQITAWAKLRDCLFDVYARLDEGDAARLELIKQLVEAYDVLPHYSEFVPANPLNAQKAAGLEWTIQMCRARLDSVQDLDLILPHP